VWLESPACVGLAEGPGYLDVLTRILDQGRVAGGMIHDARIAAVCAYNGVSVLWTADRDFSRFPLLKTHNPLAQTLSRSRRNP